MRTKLITLVCLGGALAGSANSAPLVFSASGATATDILSTVNAFRESLGTLNPNLPTNFSGGRREVNWDGVPASASEPNAFPGNFFNGNVAGRARGIESSTPGSRLLVSVPDAEDDYIAFSPSKVFEAEDSFEIDNTFFSPRHNTVSALTSGFGVVFLDIDEANTSYLEFFNQAGTSLGKYFVPAAPGEKTFSFLGVKFDSNAIARVRIVSGSATDETAVDDFIYAEPSPVPEPSAYLLAAGGLATIGLLRRRKTL